MTYVGRERVGRAAQVRALDAAAIRERGVPSAVLMESASRAATDEAERLLAQAGASGPAVVLCGSGNNGGDGLALARTLWNRGHAAVVVRVGAGFDARGRLGPDVQLQLQLLPEPLTDTALDLRADGAGLPRVEAALDSAGLVVDALFGTGLTREVGGEFAAALEACARCTAPRLAIDLPSGLHADTGALLGPVPVFEATVTFACWKPGLLAGEGPRVAGRVEVAEIGIPRDLVERLDRVDGSPA